MIQPGFTYTPDLQARLDEAEREREAWREQGLGCGWDEIELGVVLYFVECSMGTITEITPGWITIKRCGIDPSRWWRFSAVPMIDAEGLPPLVQAAEELPPEPRKPAARPAVAKPPAAAPATVKAEPKQRALF